MELSEIPPPHSLDGSVVQGSGSRTATIPPGEIRSKLQERSLKEQRRVSHVADSRLENAFTRRMISFPQT